MSPNDAVTVYIVFTVLGSIVGFFLTIVYDYFKK